MIDPSAASSAERIESDEAFDRIGEEWDRLHAAAASAGIFNTFAWMRTWWRHFGEGRRLRVIALRRAGELVALAPLEITARSLGPLRYRALQLIGTGALPARGMGLSDRSDLLVRRGCEDVFPELCRALAADADWDVLLLRGIPQGSATPRALVDGLGEEGAIRLAQRSTSYLLPLPDSWEGFLETRSKKWKKVHRARVNRAEREGPVEFERYFPCDARRLEALWPELVRVNDRSWKAESGTGLLQVESLRDFFRELCSRMAAAGRLDVSVARLAGEIFAYELYFSSEEVVGAYDGAYDESHSALSPGILLGAFILNDSIERGMKAFDFLRGEESYKLRFGGERLAEQRLALYRRRGIAGLAARVAIEGRARLKRSSRLERLADRMTGAAVKRKRIR
ncbi:MAG: GNAT family N-acetyltransferase [bacterium]|nr:GNAT family N-acetyltransferase [bacterium]